VAALVALLLSAAGPLAARPASGEHEHQGSELRHRLTEEERARIEAVRKEMEEARSAYGDAMREMVEMQRQLAEEQISWTQLIRYPGRAGIGVVVQTEPDPEADRLGARIVAVTPGGSAEEAGLEAGDVIVGFRGQPLPKRFVEGAEVTRSTPAVWLISRARELKPGDDVEVRYLRDGKERTVRLEARPIGRRGLEVAPAWVISRDSTRDVAGLLKPDDILRTLPDLRVLLPELNLLEMVELNPDLGEYFGTDSGVLVVHAPEDSVLKIRSGDVLLGVGELEARTPEQAVRVLQSVRPGEPLVLHVIRKGNRIILRTEAPEIDEQRVRFRERGRRPD
jgi:membrane-associated protease RseP (regulator of RpoE activity)